MNPDGRVEHLIEEGRPLHVGVEVIKLLHSHHLPAVKEEPRISIKDLDQDQRSVSRMKYWDQSYVLQLLQIDCILSVKEGP